MPQDSKLTLCFCFLRFLHDESSKLLPKYKILVILPYPARLKTLSGFSLLLSALLTISSLTGGLFLVHSDTFAQAQSPQSTFNRQITAPLDVADSIYSANTTKFLGMKNISLTPYRITEVHSSDQGFLKGVGNVTNNQTYIGTYLSDELRQSIGNGTFETPDGQSFDWIYSAIGRPVDGRWVFHGIILFNNTQSESLALLSNSIGLSKNTAGNEPQYIWLLE
jgi:hypothetical protein